MGRENNNSKNNNSNNTHHRHHLIIKLITFGVKWWPTEHIYKIFMVRNPSKTSYLGIVAAGHKDVREKLQVEDKLKSSDLIDRCHIRPRITSEQAIIGTQHAGHQLLNHTPHT